VPVGLDVGHVVLEKKPLSFVVNFGNQGVHLIQCMKVRSLEMSAEKMHADELEIDEALVRRMLAEQFAEWSELPLSRVEPAGTVNAIFRLGGDLSLRLPRHEGPTEPGGKDVDWLPRLAPLLPLEIPVPVAQGRPTDEYPWFWDVCTWVEGETVPIKEIDAIQAARDLAGFVAALQKVDPANAPPGRGIPLARPPGAKRR
jgi:aminoglycoside phosphotransferase (APT) family kinase protein